MYEEVFLGLAQLEARERCDAIDIGACQPFRHAKCYHAICSPFVARRWQARGIQRILKRWPGRVRLVFKHFPLEQHANALPAARVAACAERQDRFWAVHDKIFGAQVLSEAVLRSAALSAGLNTAEFEACMRNDEVLERVRKDMLVGVAGTPAFFVNRQPVENADQLEATVERILGGAR